MTRFGVASLGLVGALLVPRIASATKSGELYSSPAYTYGRFEARMRFAAGDGVVSAFFLWKSGSEMPGTFWNELDYEKVGANCELHTNALYGNPSANHTTTPAVNADLCGGFHVYGYEWTADHIAWSLDGTEVRRETGETATAFAQNASAGMQVHFNLWPGDASFGGNFNPSILPVHQYVDWVQFSSYADGAFTLAWREDFDGSAAPSGWYTGDWGSPKNLSTHDPLNVNFLSGCAVLSITADDATGPAGAVPEGCSMGDPAGTGGMSGNAGTSGDGGTSGNGGTAGTAAGASATGAAGGAGGSGGTTAVGGASGTAATTGGVSGAGAGGPNGGAGTAVGGSSGSAGSGAAAGAQAGNAGAMGGASSVGGSPMGSNSGTGGAGATAGEPANDDTTTEASNGCGCRVPGSTRSSQRGSGIGAALLLALAGVLRRRRMSR